jgi:hypothetical protein
MSELGPLPVAGARPDGSRAADKRTARTYAGLESVASEDVGDGS